MREGGDAHRGGGGECGRNECRILLTCGVDVRCGVLALSWSWGRWWEWCLLFVVVRLSGQSILLEPKNYKLLSPEICYL